MTSYSDYVQHYIPLEKRPLLDAVLDQGHDTAKDLNEIAQYPTRWEQQLSHHLELTQSEIDDINEIRDPILRRRRVLQVWKDKKRLNATYGRLLNVCILGGDTRTATKICELITQKPLLQRSPATPQATPMAHPPVPQGHHPPVPPGQPQVGYSGYPTSSGQPVGHPSPVVGYGAYPANSGHPPVPGYMYSPQAQYPPQNGGHQQFIPQGQGGGYVVTYVPAQGPPPPGGYGPPPPGSFPPGAFQQNSGFHATHLSSGQAQVPGFGSSAQQSAMSAQVATPQVAASTVPRAGATKTLLESHHYGILCEQLHPCAHQWRKLAEGLRFQPYEIENIQADPLKLSGAPGSYLGAVLSSWMLWAPGDARGSMDFATLEHLKRVVDQAGFPQIAAGLKLEED